jgi:alkanesulfonate monooxygenase SsuD/methylene tetrahydromethanopterin reductase-like flavin-dependent oxidoreductase (luciferase family)
VPESSPKFNDQQRISIITPRPMRFFAKRSIDLFAKARHAEGVGFDSVLLSEHLDAQPPFAREPR